MNIKRNIVAIACAALAGLAASAVGVEDALVSFHTVGPDCYADGTVVQDGECYALVWSRDGVFEGLTASGAPIDPADRVVLVAPMAKNGRCRDVIFQVPAELVDELAGGVYDVLLLDTRVNKDGEVVPQGTVAGNLALVNGYGTVADAVTVTKGASGQPGETDGAVTDGGRAVASASPAPANLPQPRIKHIRIEGDNVFLTVENLPGFMRVQGGATVSASDSVGAATPTDGGDSDVVLVTRKTGNSGFFRVIRN